MNYDLLRGLHILSVIAWMAGIMYLPRLFAYHTQAEPGSEMDQTFQTMERKLFNIIMRPAMVATWVFGLALIYIDAQMRGWSFLAEPWMIAKLCGVVFITGWQGFLGASLKAFAEGRNKRSNKFWRATNELPFLAAIVMVIAVTTEFKF